MLVTVQDTPLTHTGPKQLLPIANRPMSEYCIESIERNWHKGYCYYHWRYRCTKSKRLLW